jgi:hypothetical protein
MPVSRFVETGCCLPFSVMMETVIMETAVLQLAKSKANMNA